MARTLDDALRVLTSANGDARVVAGGTDLVLQQRSGYRKAGVLVDISRIPGLSEISEDNGWLHLGALVTHAQAATSPLVRRYLPALADACSQVGSPQIRNMGTLVGNIVSAQPGADAALALHAFDAQVIVRESVGIRTMELAALYEGVGLCCIDSTREVITGLKINMYDGNMGSAFERLSQRGTLTLPVINVAVALRMNGGAQTIDDARVVVGPVSPRPFRSFSAEKLLCGAAPSVERFTAAGKTAAEESNPRQSVLRGSREYRQAMVAVLVRRGLERAAGGRRMS